MEYDSDDDDDGWPSDMEVSRTKKARKKAWSEANSGESSLLQDKLPKRSELNLVEAIGLMMTNRKSGKSLLCLVMIKVTFIQFR